MPWIIGAAIGGSGLLSAGASLFGSSQASSAAKSAAALQEQQYQTTRSDLLPYNQAGQGALSGLSSLANGGQFGPGGTNYLQMAQGALPGQMTEAQLQQTPGYQFQLGQGLAATQNSAAARGLGVSGSALKGAATFATGLADSNYQTQFQNQQTQYGDYIGLNSAQQGNLTNQYNRLLGTASLGESAAAGTGSAGTAAASAAGNSLTAAGSATASGTAGVGNALSGAANNYLGYNLLQQQIANGGSGTTPGYSATNPVNGSTYTATNNLNDTLQ